MLQEIIDRDTIEKRVAVRTGSEAFTQILERLLLTWGFVIGNQDDQSALLLLEDECGEPVAGQKTVWLSKSEQGQLGLPVTIESLWQVLEQHFHSPPRMHMRKTVDLPARVSLRGAWHETRLSSLSDMGARFSHDRELVKQEPVIIELSLFGALLQYRGQVIFSMAEGPADVPIFQAGVVFHKQDSTLRDDLCSYLIRQYLETVRAGMELQVFQAGLVFFDLAPGVRNAFLETD